MKKQNIVLFSVLLMAFALTGCRSARQAESPARVSRKPQNEQLIPLAQYPEKRNICKNFRVGRIVNLNYHTMINKTK